MQALPFENSYAQLPDDFFVRSNPEPVSEPRLIKLNNELADELQLGLDLSSENEIARIFAGNETPENAEPLAMAYAGHQFGNFVPQLGDGRALLLGEVIDRHGRRRDIQLKGAGRTPFGRGGDGRAPVGPALREYLVSEAMHALGVPTTRALALVTTGESVFREAALPGAVITRVASSHIRVGTFQFFAARDNRDNLRRLADYAIERHYPEVAQSDNRYKALLEAVCTRQAELVADWMAVGFIHGVMNTDNVAIAGETLDYGPCAFMDTYHPDTVFSSIDRGGRYAYRQQPVIAQWDLARFAESILPLLHEDESTAIEEAKAVINDFPSIYLRAWLTRMRAKLGLATEEDGDQDLVEDLLALMARDRVDFTLGFRRLAEAAENPVNNERVAELFASTAEWYEWEERWRHRLDRDAATASDSAARMRSVNPAVIPRNHRVEDAIAAAVQGDFTLFEQLHERLSRPFEDDAADDASLAPPADGEEVQQTFCGT
jgi:uncharacterized protein YdiU (UPF0061 family)